MSKIGNTIWRGSKDLVETPDSPKWSFDATTTVTRTFHGPYEKCISQCPQRGSGLAGYAGFTVTKVGVDKAPGNKGVLTIVADGTAMAMTWGSPPEVKYEIDWVAVERPLRLHHEFQTGGTWPLTEEDLCQIKKWEEESIPEIRAEFGFETGTSGYDVLSDNAIVYARKILKGQESFVEYAPVCRKTTTSVDSPAESNAGLIGDPEGFGSALPSGFEYLKTADRSFRAAKHGRWDRTEEWTGAKEWDTDLYDSVV